MKIRKTDEKVLRETTVHFETDELDAHAQE